MRAISRFIPDVGISTVSWSAWLAFRIRVSMSPIGSLVIASSPARLRHSGNHSLVGQLAQADAADAELAEIAARPPAPVAAVIAARRILRAPCLLDPQCLFCHTFPRLSRKRHPERAQELAGPVVVGCGGRD